MPITDNELKQSNQSMLGNTNRGILFTTVNLSQDAPRLSQYMAYLQHGVYSFEKFESMIREKLAVRSFSEFLDKFQPCIYYRLVPAAGSVVAGDEDEEEYVVDEESGAAEEGNEEEFEAESAQYEEGTEESEVIESEEFADADEYRVEDLPSYRFSLEGGPGWKKVLIDMNHPFFRSLQSLIRERGLMAKTAFRTDVDSALFGFKPHSRHMQVRKIMTDFQAVTDKLMLEMRRDPDSKDTQKALEGYIRKQDELANALGDEMTQLPIIVYGLNEAYKALGEGGGTGGGLSSTTFALELGERGKIVAKPKELTGGLTADRKELEGGDARPALEGGGNEIVTLKQSLESRPLAKREISEIVKLDQKEQLPALVGSFMNEMVRLGKVDPLVGNLIAVAIQDPRQITTWNLNTREIAVYHDSMLGVYSDAIESFLRVVTPLFETLMGVYLLFNEFPPEVRKGQPEVIVTNDELTDLMQVYPEELATYMQAMCHQATNRYQSAISYAIVPSVMPFQSQNPNSVPQNYIAAGDFVNQYHAKAEVKTEEDRIMLDKRIEELRKKQIKASGTAGYGRATEAGAMLGFLELAYSCGVTVFFSPEDKVIAGYTNANTVSMLQDNYCQPAIVDREWAVSGVLCLPDFVCVPRDGILITGRVADGRDVGTQVPELTVRACYVAAGKFMANESPEVLSYMINQLPPETKRALPMKVRPSLPGVGLDLTKYTPLGATRMPVDHFLNDAVIKQLTGRDKSFLVFNQVAGMSPNITQARTMKRKMETAGDRYRLVHHYRQEVYFKRLINTAYHLGFGGAIPTAEEMTKLMDQIINYIGWYDVNSEGYVNSFPSKLSGNKILVEPVEEGGEVIGFNLTLPFEAAITGEMLLSFA